MLAHKITSIAEETVAQFDPIQVHGSNNCYELLTYWNTNGFIFINGSLTNEFAYKKFKEVLDDVYINYLSESILIVHCNLLEISTEGLSYIFKLAKILNWGAQNGTSVKVYWTVHNNHHHLIEGNQELLNFCDFEVWFNCSNNILK